MASYEASYASALIPFADRSSDFRPLRRLYEYCHPLTDLYANLRHDYHDRDGFLFLLNPPYNTRISRVLRTHACHVKTDRIVKARGDFADIRYILCHV
ncbi:MAG: hypothetical protein VB111_05205 [Clostridiaceae bacterium]|nr:hypothetical protein [Clostridiaceae bacterium]